MVHRVNKSDWPKQTWQYPIIHEYKFAFGLSAEDATKASTIVPYMFQDNALIDYENIKTNPENADFATVAYPNVLAGSYIPKISVNWMMYLPSADLEITMLKVDTMQIGISMLNRLDAFDKKTGNDIETILELQHETTDEQAGPLYNNTKIFEPVTPQDLDFTKVPFLTTNGQLEGVAFDKDLFFQAMHYYTNKEMLKTVTNRMKSHTIVEPIIPHGRAIQTFSRMINVPPMCKFAQPYDYCGELFSVPQVGSTSQYHTAADTTAVEHVSVVGFVKFFEFNPDLNFARA